MLGYGQNSGRIMPGGYSLPIGDRVPYVSIAYLGNVTSDNEFVLSWS